MPGRDSLVAFLEWAQRIGPLGAVLFGAAFIPAAVLLLPASLLTLGAGFTFGVLKGTIIVSIGSTAGAAAAFLVARTIGRDWAARRMAARPMLRAIALAVHVDAFKIVLLTRLSPLFPFNLLNYAFGLTSIPFGTYVLASWIGMMPGTLMYVYLGAAANNLAALLSGEIRQSAGQRAMFVVGLIASVLVTVIVTRRAKQVLAGIVSNT
jgi:uncharacterized membrane protein YdjX (TVP38/TMEM64 family)